MHPCRLTYPSLKGACRQLKRELFVNITFLQMAGMQLSFSSRFQSLPPPRTKPIPANKAHAAANEAHAAELWSQRAPR